MRHFHRKRQNAQVPLEADVVELLALRSVELRQQEDDKLAALRACLAELTERNRGVIEGYYGGRTAGWGESTRALRGRIDELAIWNRALPEDELSRPVEAGRPSR